MLPSAVFIEKQSTEAQILTQQEPPDNNTQTVFFKVLFSYAECTRGWLQSIFCVLAFQRHSWTAIFQAEREKCAYDVCNAKVVSQMRGFQKNHIKRTSQGFTSDTTKRNPNKINWCKKVACIYLHKEFFLVSVHFFVSAWEQVWSHGFKDALLNAYIDLS